MSVVVPFLNQQTFFITGATGLVGKIAVLKLLYHCPDAKLILLVRGKKDLPAKERFEKEIIRESPIFDDFLRDRPDAMNNVTVVNGDISEDRLGMSDDDIEMIKENVTCILHIAATVSFNEPLEVAFSINVFGTRSMLDLAKSCVNLVSMVHISTAYVNSIRINQADDVKEKIYPLDFDMYHLMDHVVNSDPADLAKQTPKIIGDHPNTYTFTKSIAEHILLEEKGDISLCIIRPSMITGAKSFPLVGWVDSFIGPAGLMLANGLGALHTLVGDPNGKPDFVPVDYVVNMMLVATWHNASNPPAKRLPVYHACSGKENNLTWHHVRSLSAGYFRRNPAKKSNGYPFIIMYKHTLPFILTHYAIQVFPALLMDTKRVIKGKKAKMFRASKQLYKIANSLAFFIMNQFSFSIKNAVALLETLNEEDSKIFDFDVRSIDWEVYLLQFTQGLKYYLLREATDNASVVHKL